MGLDQEPALLRFEQREKCHGSLSDISEENIQGYRLCSETRQHTRQPFNQFLKVLTASIPKQVKQY